MTKPNWKPTADARIHMLRVTLSTIHTLAETAPINPKTMRSIRNAAKLSLDRDTDFARVGTKDKKR
jgi:hypothetical protein